MRSRIVLAVAALGLAATGLAALPDDPSGGPPGARGSLSGQGAGEQPRQTSDGVPGEIAEEIPTGVLNRPRVSNERSWRVARGVSFRRWDQTDRRGRVRAHLLTVNPSRRGVRLDYASLAKVPDRGPLTALLRRDGKAVGGVNGGFFDIADTGAPLGVGRDRQRGFLHASKLTWTNAFSVDRSGRARVGDLEMEATIREFPQIEVTNLNSPRVREGSVGIYTRGWGVTSGYSVTDGQAKDVRMVVVRDGRVTATSTELSSDEPIRGTVLVGRGPGAAHLEELTVGTTVTVDWRLPGSLAFAISGETTLLSRGQVVATDDVYLHPRTAVGVDRDTGKVLLLVVDGRQEHSRGYTLVELARMLKRLGAETALNLDGGGSSTVAGLTRRDRLRTLNSPSDGSQRPIPDGIAVLVR